MCLVQEGVGKEVNIEREITMVGPEEALGYGVGMLLTAATANGCLLGAAAIGERGKSAQDLGRAAARELQEDIQAGGCVDRW